MTYSRYVGTFNPINDRYSKEYTALMHSYSVLYFEQDDTYNGILDFHGLTIDVNICDEIIDNWYILKTWDEDGMLYDIGRFKPY